MEDVIKNIMSCNINEKGQIDLYDVHFDDFNHIEEFEDNYYTNEELIRDALMAMFIYDTSPKGLCEFINQKQYEVIFKDKIIKIENKSLNENSNISELVDVLTDAIYDFLKEIAKDYEEDYEEEEDYDDMD